MSAIQALSVIVTESLCCELFAQIVNVERLNSFIGAPEIVPVPTEFNDL